MSTITTLTSAELDAVNGGSYVSIKKIYVAVGGNGGTAITGSVTGNTKFGKSISVAVNTGDASANGGNATAG
ncbi:hypothetical protein JMJ56_08835 [Belnapia sp. T18]|uniref:Uncharacterized protein n=1 Tax=Belnapia arida TaxID=2804533 RepID=A0ABS1U0A4_9PROT|nr:hypothetical protein [Belnapia arida]MBL6078110.1 hypothetical protein [Belnapia arida]